MTEELEYVPGRFVVNRITRPRFACAGCERFAQSPLPSRPIERGRPGPGLLAHVLVSKYADHLPLYRQSQLYAREGIELDRSTMAGWVGRTTTLLAPLVEVVARHVFDAFIPSMSTIRRCRCWLPEPARHGRRGCGPMCATSGNGAARRHGPALYRFSPDRKGIHPARHLAGFEGWMHADGYAGFEDLYRGGAIGEVACMAHVRRKFVDVHRAQGSSIAAEAVERIGHLYAVEKAIRGSPPDDRARIRQDQAAPIFDDLERWLAEQLTMISGKTPLAAAIRYARGRMRRLRPYLDDGRLALDNNPAERAMRGVALGRKNFMFVGSEAGGHAAAVAYTLIETAKLNGVDPEAWLSDTLARLPDYKITRIAELLPWRPRPAMP